MSKGDDFPNCILREGDGDGDGDGDGGGDGGGDGDGDDASFNIYLPTQTHLM